MPEKKHNYQAMKNNAYILSTLLITLLTAVVNAATYRVAHDGAYDFNTIYKALRTVQTGDTIVVAEGEYNAATGELFPLDIPQGVRLQAENPDEKPIIDALQSSTRGAVFSVISVRDYNTIIDGFEITGGLQGNIYLEDANMTIRNCLIRDCGYAVWGGGVMCNKAGPHIISCHIMGNLAAVGGGIAIDTGSPTIIDCTITDNMMGGGVEVYDGSPTLIRCTITSNNHFMGASGLSFYGGSARVYDCTIAHNIKSFGGAAGVLCEEGSPKFEGCIIRDNIGISSGGGVTCKNSSASFKDCVFRRNFANHGGGIILESDSLAKIDSCVFHENITESFGYGGGILCRDRSDAKIFNCLFYDNWSYYGGAVGCMWSQPDIINCVFYNNIAEVGGGGIYNQYSSANVTNCISWNNYPNEISTSATVTYCDVMGGFSGTGNIDEDPLFINVNASDFHLQRRSPCIDTGTNSGAPNADLAGNTRPNPATGQADMGAFEYYASAETPTPLPTETPIPTETPQPVTPLPTYDFIRVAHQQPYDYNTITAALQNAQRGQIIKIVADVNYSYSNGESFPLYMKAGICMVSDDPLVKPVIGPTEYNSEVLLNVTDIKDMNTIIQGIRFIGALSFHNSVIKINNCEITKNVIKLQNSNPLFDNCFIHKIYGDLMTKGGAIQCISSNPLIENCIITLNQIDPVGGGLYCYDSSPTLRNTQIMLNVTGYLGGGLYCTEKSKPKLINCNISQNYAFLNGGGIYCSGESMVTLTDCNITENFVTNGGGGGCYNAQGSKLILDTCYIKANYSLLTGSGSGIQCALNSSVQMENTLLLSHSGIVAGGIYGLNSDLVAKNCTIYNNSNFLLGVKSDIRLRNCIIWNNGTNPIMLENSTIDAQYCDVEGGLSGTGNIEWPPLFMNAANGDFHLRPSSLCIDAGTNTGAPDFDFDGEARPNPATGQSDIGVDEFYTTYLTPTPAITPTPTADPCQLIIVAGYWDTHLDVPNGGTWTMLAVVEPNDNSDVTAIEVLYNGMPIGIELHDDGRNGDWTWRDSIWTYELTLPSQIPSAMLILELQVSTTGDSCVQWPYLLVK